MKAAQANAISVLTVTIFAAGVAITVMGVATRLPSVAPDFDTAVIACLERHGTDHAVYDACIEEARAVTFTAVTGHTP